MREEIIVALLKYVSPLFLLSSFTNCNWATTYEKNRIKLFLLRTTYWGERDFLLKNYSKLTRVIRLLLLPHHGTFVNFITQRGMSRWSGRNDIMSMWHMLKGCGWMSKINKKLTLWSLPTSLIIHQSSILSGLGQRWKVPSFYPPLTQKW